MKVTVHLLLTYITASSAKLRGAKHMALEEDVTFWTNLRNLQYMSLPDRPLTSNSITLSTNTPTSSPMDVTAPIIEVNDTGASTSVNEASTTSAPSLITETNAPTPSPQTVTPFPTSSSDESTAPTVFEATPFPTSETQRSKTSFTCPDASFVGCTDPRTVARDECQTVGQVCGEGMYCCRDACPRNYCTGKSG